MASEFDTAVQRLGGRVQAMHAMQVAAGNRVVLLLRMLAEPDPFEREGDEQRFAAQGLRFGAARQSLFESGLAAEERSALDAALVHAVRLSQSQREIVTLLVQGLDEQTRQRLQATDVLGQQRALIDALEALAGGCARPPCSSPAAWRCRSRRRSRAMIAP